MWLKLCAVAVLTRHQEKNKIKVLKAKSGKKFSRVISCIKIKICLCHQNPTFWVNGLKSSVSRTCTMNQLYACNKLIYMWKVKKLTC